MAPKLRSAWDECQLRMHKLDKILGHVQRKQETGESSEEEQGQLEH